MKISSYLISHNIKSTVSIAIICISVTLNITLVLAIYQGITTPHAVRALFHRPPPVRKIITCWGDSLTAGAGVEFGRDFPRLLAAALGRQIFSGAFANDTSTQIKQHMLARAAGLDAGVTIIWAGRNDFFEPDTVKANIQDMVASLPDGSHYLVLGVLNGDYPGESLGESGYKLLINLNKDLAAAFGDHYLPVREYLVSAAKQDSAQDRDDRARDIVPSSLRSDEIHLNRDGYVLVAAFIEQVIISKGW